MKGAPLDIAGRRVTGSPVPPLDSIVRPATAMPPCPLRHTRLHARFDPQPMVWVDKDGVAKVIRDEFAGFATPRLLPHGTRIAVEISKGQPDIWILTLATGTLSPLTSGGSNASPE